MIQTPASPASISQLSDTARKGACSPINRSPVRSVPKWRHLLCSKNRQHLNSSKEPRQIPLLWKISSFWFARSPHSTPRLVFAYLYPSTVRAYPQIDEISPTWAFGLSSKKPWSICGLSDSPTCRSQWPGCKVLWAVALAGKHGAAILSITVPRDPSAGPSDFKGLWAMAEESAAEHGQPDTL